MILSLFIIVMIIPTTIVFGKGKDLPNLQQFINQFMQKQSGTQKSLLTIGWVTGNGASVMNLANYQNLKIVSPALATIDNQYDLQINSDPSLTNKIREQGKNVWARLLIQSDTNVNVHSFLADHSKTKEAIRKLNEAAQANHWYGVNVDIENVKREDRQAFSQFMKDLSGQLDKGKILLSIDLPPDPAGRNTNTPFDHELLGKYCDYIIFMGYDQHWSTDPVPGPVTSLPWLKENLQEYIRTGIPPEKLILGLPAYTRVWQLDQQGHVVKDPAMPVQSIENELEQNHRTLTWNPQLGEYYTSYTVNNIQYKIWLSTKKSYDLYLGLVSQFHLAGTAVWNLNQIQPDYWNKIYGMKEKNSNL
jgi:spore germination protein YaaH